MSKLSDREYALTRKIKDLEHKNYLLKQEIAQLSKKLDKVEVEEPKKVKSNKPHVLTCPKCSAIVNITELPFGKLHLCSSGCGYREVKK